MAMADDSGEVVNSRRSDAATRRTARLAKLRAKAFSAARRHTALVKSLRLLLPLSIAGIVAAYGAYIYAKTGISIAGGKATVEGFTVTADDLKMSGVKYTGQAKDGSRYDVRARDAAVDFAQTGPTKLNHIDGELVQPNGVVTKLKSRAGVVDNKKGELDLSDGVNIVSTNGLRATMKSAKVYTKESRILANEGVTADMPTGRITADKMDIETKAKKGTFHGNVAVRLAQDQAAAKPLLALGRETRAPVEVKATRLDIDDSKRFASFTGGVTAAQGESTLRSADLHITYEGRTATPGAPPPTDLMTETGATKVQKLKATGGVSITSGIDRRVQADTVEFDVPGDLATFVGATVEVQQGKNRLLGRRLIVDRKTGKTTLDAPAEGRTPVGRIQTTFYQVQDGKPKPKAAVPADASGSSGGVMNFKTDPNAPMDVAAERLDVNDAAKQAIYRGAVRAQQGDFIMETTELVATYTGDTGLVTPAEGAAAKGATTQMSKVEAKSKVLITSREGQSLRGEWAIFDVKANIVTVGGPVFVKQGLNEISGRQLRIDMTTGEAKFDDVPGQAKLAPAIAPSTQPKSAIGPGGLPAVGAQPAAVVSPGCPPGGRACVTFYPETAKTLQKQGQDTMAAKNAAAKSAVPKAIPKPASPAPAGATPPGATTAASTKPKSDGWSPQTNSTASPTYRAPTP